MKRLEFIRLVVRLGTFAQYTHAKTGTVDTMNYCLWQSTSRASDAIINSYGVNGREFIFRSTDMTETPLRLDTITIQGERFTLDVVVPLYEDSSGELIGYRCYAKGK